MSDKSTANAGVQRFWRDGALPFIEAREVMDGRAVCYDRHSHETFSIGAITAGCSTYMNGAFAQRVEEGAVVMMNPGEVHACNPVDGQPWSYLMFYVDAHWLGHLQAECGQDEGSGAPRFHPFATALSSQPALYEGLRTLWRTLIDADAGLLHKESTAIDFFAGLVQQHGALLPLAVNKSPGLVRAAEYIAAHCTEPLRLDDICKTAGLSPSYLIRAFKACHAMTPHEYLINCRIQFGRAQLARGVPIAEVAAASGFADQAHFNRAFKRLVAATPGQYRRPLRLAKE